MKKVRPLVLSLVMMAVLVTVVLVGWFVFGIRPVLGLDLQGGIQVVLQAPAGTPQSVMEKARLNILNRVDALGVGEPSVSVVNDEILVQIPSTAQGKVEKRGEEWCVITGAGKNLGCKPTQAEAQAVLQQTGQDRVIQLIGTTARLEEREVLATIAKDSADWNNKEWAVTCPTEADKLSPECSFQALADKEVIFLSPDGATKFKLGPAEVTGDMITKATAVYRSAGDLTSGSTPGWRVTFVLSSAGSKIFGDVTTKLVNKQLAIVVDQQVISAPTVQEAITQGSGEITGGFSEQEAKDLATELNAGALPVQLAQSNVETVSATLGRESLRQGLIAGLAGLLALALYLLFYYRLLGIVTWLGMAIWATLALGLVSLAGRTFGYALTLAGVAGLIVSIGITTDSYIVFYERLKDDIRHGKTPRTAVQPAFKRAWRTIVAADIVTMLAAAVLYMVAAASVRGVALTLGLCTMLDMFVVYFFKRPTVFLIARSGRLTNLRGMGLTSGVAADHGLAEAST